MKIGAHLFINKGLNSVFELSSLLGCDSFQVFLHNPRGWYRKPREDDELGLFKGTLKKTEITPVVVHMPYLMNFASPDKSIVLKSSKILEIELEECEKMGVSFYVIHPGSHKGLGVKYGIDLIVDNLKHFTGSKVKILLENTAGQGNSIGSRWSELGEISDKLHNKVGICFDTAHAFASGYDIRNVSGLNITKEEIKKYVGLENIFIIHANDSLSQKGSKLDRHENIGKGHIGLKGFENLVEDVFFGNLPFIIETPKKNLDDDIKNLSILKNLREKYGKI